MNTYQTERWRKWKQNMACTVKLLCGKFCLTASLLEGLFFKKISIKHFLKRRMGYQGIRRRDFSNHNSQQNVLGCFHWSKKRQEAGINASYMLFQLNCCGAQLIKNASDEAKGKVSFIFIHEAAWFKMEVIRSVENKTNVLIVHFQLLLSGKVKNKHIITFDEESVWSISSKKIQCYKCVCVCVYFYRYI